MLACDNQHVFKIKISAKKNGFIMNVQESLNFQKENGFAEIVHSKKKKDFFNEKYSYKIINYLKSIKL